MCMLNIVFFLLKHFEYMSSILDQNQCMPTDERDHDTVNAVH